MIINILRLQEDVSVEVSGEYNPKDLELEFVDWKYTEVLRLNGTVEKGRETLRFQGRLTSAIEQVCGRCLKIVKSQLNHPFQFYYEIKGREQIDTTDDLRESLMLIHPLSYQCREDCRGLCPQCGVDMNLTQCSCHLIEEKKISVFSPLQQLWEKMKEERKHG